MRHAKRTDEKTTARKTTELIVKFLNDSGHFAWRQVNTPVRRRKNIVHRGTGDIVGILKNGKHMEVEVKNDDDVMSLYQEQHKEMIEKRFGYYFVAKSFDDFYKQYGDMFNV